MVHALEQVYELLKNGGHLIDIHPSEEKVAFIYPMDDGEYFIGHMEETDDYIEYRQADEALQAVLARGLFQVENVAEFTFHTHAESFDELKAYLDENWSDAVITEDVITRAHEFQKKFGKRKVILREKAKMGVLRKQV